MTNLYVPRVDGKRNQSMQFNSGALNSRSRPSYEKSGSVGVATQADLMTDVESTHQALIRQEHKQLQGYAKTRLQQKHERKLFRPQTGVITGTGRLDKP